MYGVEYKYEFNFDHLSPEAKRRVAKLVEMPDELKVMRWKGPRTPQRALLGDQVVIRTENGFLTGNSGNVVGEYVRLVEYGGEGKHAHVLLVSTPHDVAHNPDGTLCENHTNLRDFWRIAIAHAIANPPPPLQDPKNDITFESRGRNKSAPLRIHRSILVLDCPDTLRPPASNRAKQMDFAFS